MPGLRQGTWMAWVWGLLWSASAAAQEPSGQEVRAKGTAAQRLVVWQSIGDEERAFAFDGEQATSFSEEEEQGEQEPISDNSFLIEEAYNQEPGVVQHIFNWVGLWAHGDARRRDFAFLYTMELPLGSQAHQLSFTPLNFAEFSETVSGGAAERDGGLGDLALNYRYQLSVEQQWGWRPAIAPRASLLLPTGDEDRGLGSGELGYQFNLPISKRFGAVALHFNAGFTFTPDVSVTLPGGGPSPHRDLRAYNLGGSAIWLATPHLNFLVETVTVWADELDEQGLRDRTTEVLINPGLRWAVYTDDSVQWVLGASLPVGLSSDAPDYGFFGYLSVEHAFRKTD